MMKGFAIGMATATMAVLTALPAKSELVQLSHEGIGLQCENATVTAASFVSYYANEPRRNTPWLLPKIAKPTLVIAGGEDQIVTGLKELVEPLTGENLRFLEVDGADHFFLDLYMEDVADAVEEFLEGRW